MHIASLVLGIIALITCFIPFFGAAIALIALIIAIAAMCIKRPNNEGRGMKIAGLVLSIIALIISIFMTAIPAGLLIANLDTDLMEEAIKELENNEEIRQDAQKLVFKTDMLSFREQYSLYLANKIMSNSDFDKSTLNVSYGDTEFTKIFGEDIDEEYKYNFKIANGELIFETDEEWKVEILKEFKINTESTDEPTDNKEETTDKKEEQNTSSNSGNVSTDSRVVNDVIKELNSSNFKSIEAMIYREKYSSTNYAYADTIKRTLQDGKYTKTDTQYFPTIYTIKVSFGKYTINILMDDSVEKPAYIMIYDGSTESSWKIENVKISTLMELTGRIEEVQMNLEEAKQQLSQISIALQNQIIQAYEGKTMSGAEVLAAVMQYKDSESCSVNVVVDKDKVFKAGKFDAIIDESVLATLTTPKEGTVPISVRGVIAPDVYITQRIQVDGGVSATQTYYSYIMKDIESEKVIGVLFVRKGANL